MPNPQLLPRLRQRQTGTAAGADDHRNAVAVGQQPLRQELQRRNAVAAADQQRMDRLRWQRIAPVSYTHLRAHETVLELVCPLLLEKKNRC